MTSKFMYDELARLRLRNKIIRKSTVEKLKCHDFFFCSVDAGGELSKESFCSMKVLEGPSPHNCGTTEDTPYGNHWNLVIRLGSERHVVDCEVRAALDLDVGYTSCPDFLLGEAVYIVENKTSSEENFVAKCRKRGK